MNWLNDATNERKVKDRLTDESPSWDCEDVRDLLYLYSCNELEPDEREQMDAHLADCAECRQALEEHRKLSVGLGGLFRNRNLYYYSVNN